MNCGHTINSHHIAGIPISAYWLCCHHGSSSFFFFFFFTIHVCWSVAPACDSPFHINAQKCEKRSARYYGVFVCRGTLQLLCGGGDMVEAILMQCPPLPDSAPILLFPFRCDSCWDWLLGDHIPGTKRAQLVWTGLSDTTSCSGCESLLSKQPFSIENIKKKKDHMSCLFYLLAFHHWVWLVWAHSSVCVCMCGFFFVFFLISSAGAQNLRRRCRLSSWHF